MKAALLKSRESRFKRYGMFWVFIAGMAALGFLAQIQWVGSVMILLLVILAIARHWPASVAYWLAYAALAMVPVGVITANWVAAQNFAAYAFLLFVGGVIQTTAELKRQHAN
jgi:dolichyl-phosphate-mannose--protein O-mannosyl transferase